MFDTHLHSKGFSTDSKMPIEDVLDFIKEKNMNCIITEHMDLNFPKEGEFIFDIDKYFKEYSVYKNNNLLLGMEMGMRMDCIDENKILEEKYPFDYIIGSLHMLNDYDIFEKELYEGKSKREIYEKYFITMLECIEKYNFIDSLGHIDYISRYSLYEDKEIYYREYGDYIDEIFKVIIEREQALELNTRRLGEKKAFENLLIIYKRYKELGGKYITIGSDSHQKSGIGNYFEEAMYIVEEANLKPVYFKDRKIQYDYI